jgi:hypothetical protein
MSINMDCINKAITYPHFLELRASSVRDSGQLVQVMEARHDGVERALEWKPVHDGVEAVWKTSTNAIAHCVTCMRKVSDHSRLIMAPWSAIQRIELVIGHLLSQCG